MLPRMGQVEKRVKYYLHIGTLVVARRAVKTKAWLRVQILLTFLALQSKKEGGGRVL